MFDSIVEAVFNHSKIMPDKLCLADDDNSVSYAEYTDLICEYAGGFINIGVKTGDRVVVEACQTIEYLAIGLALQLIGAIFVPVEHNLAVEKIRSFIARADAAAVVTRKQYGLPNGYTYERFIELREGFAPEAFPKRDDICEILFSTGTTGKEKGVIITHENNLALSENVIFGVEMQADNVEMIPSPMNHSHGLRRYYANMYNGSTVILLGSAMDMPRFIRNMSEYGVNSIDLVPSALAVVLRLSKDKLADYRDVLRYIQFGAAPMIEADKIRICELLPYTRLYNFYGSTESGCISIYDFNRPNDKSNCVGKPTRNAEIFIVDDARREIASSQSNTGLLASRGGMNTQGYWRDEAETAKVLSDGVVYSNDEGYFDADGDIILLGRKGDVINVGGNKVSPEEIENATRKIAGVLDCCVVAVNDPYKGSVPKLFVVLAEGCAFDPADIHSRLSSELEPYKLPVYLEHIEHIPRSYNGKLLRKELK